MPSQLPASNDEPRKSNAKIIGSNSQSNIPVATVTRMALYLRELQRMHRSGLQRVQSGTIAKRLGLNDSQVRRDLACFGHFGQRGVGYSIPSLTKAIQSILGTDRSWNVVLIGSGNLGRALSGYKGFSQLGFRLVGVFDIAQELIGTSLESMTIRALDELENIIGIEKVELAILAVPASSAPGMAQRLEMAGVTGILNFAPVTVRSPGSGLTVVDVDLAVEMQRLAFAVVNQKGN